MDLPTLEDLDCLVLWPSGTLGEENERRCVATLLRLCEEHGFGRVAQLTSSIEAIWRNKEAGLKQYQNIKRRHFEEMAEAERVLGEELGRLPVYTRALDAMGSAESNEGINRDDGDLNGDY